MEPYTVRWKTPVGAWTYSNLWLTKEEAEKTARDTGSSTVKVEAVPITTRIEEWKRERQGR